MVHIQYSPITRGTVMASLRFKHMTHQTVPSTLVLRITHVETPVRWQLDWVRRHCLYKAPNKHDQAEIKNDCVGYIPVITKLR